MGIVFCVACSALGSIPRLYEVRGAVRLAHLLYQVAGSSSHSADKHAGTGLWGRQPLLVFLRLRGRQKTRSSFSVKLRLLDYEITAKRGMQDRYPPLRAGNTWLLGKLLSFRRKNSSREGSNEEQIAARVRLLPSHAGMLHGYRGAPPENMSSSS